MHTHTHIPRNSLIASPQGIHGQNTVQSEGFLQEMFTLIPGKHCDCRLAYKTLSGVEDYIRKNNEGKKLPKQLKYVSQVLNIYDTSTEMKQTMMWLTCLAWCTCCPPGTVPQPGSHQSHSVCFPVCLPCATCPRTHCNQYQPALTHTSHLIHL